MRVAKQYMDTNSVNKETKFSSTSQLNMITKFGIKVCVLADSHFFNKSKAHTYLISPNVLKWQE